MLLVYKNISLFPLIALALDEKVFLIVLAVVFALLVLTSFLLAFLPDRVSTFSRLGEKVDFNIRYYTYNYATQTVYSFDKKDFSHIKSESIDTFLNQFSGVSHNEVKLWLSRIINGESQEQFLQANVRLSSNKRLMTTMLELTSVNSKKNIIHFSSRMLPFLSPFEEIDLLKAKKRKKVRTTIRIPKRYLLKDEGAAEHFLTDKRYDRIGATFYVSLYSRETLISKEDYQKLSKIAPVIPYKTKAWSTSWRAQTIENATPLGKKKEAQALIKKTEELIAKKTAQYPKLKNKTAAFLSLSTANLSSFYIYLNNDPRAAYLKDLGFTTPKSIHKLANGSKDFSITVSSEKANQLSDVDLIVTYGKKSDLKALQKDALIGQIPAIKAGHVVFIEPSSDLAAGATPSILSIPYNLDHYLKAMNKALS